MSQIPISTPGLRLTLIRAGCINIFLSSHFCFYRLENVSVFYLKIRILISN